MEPYDCLILTIVRESMRPGSGVPHPQMFDAQPARENCGRLFVHTALPIEAGEELFIEYHLATDNLMDEDVRAKYGCRCATVCCRQ